MGTFLILEQEREKMIIPGSEMYALFLGAPSGHLAIKVDECGVATEDNGPVAFIITANPRCEETVLLAKRQLMQSQQQGSLHRASATSGAHTYMMSQDTKGIRPSINEELCAYTIQYLVNSALKI
eukprot:9214792-Pyramimonas_sp.AAC.1